ncbi:F-box/LRR-repeat protein 15 [Varanus komodoensis]|uniref:F-box/LRR-repeat protein 15 n=1 Tax=Varanus komodoensis TaxID=61221 RepID=UPI001CF7ADCC|nr:F-box/LRR-repeat protein 15 [Varanus komodoensis]
MALKGEFLVHRNCRGFLDLKERQQGGFPHIRWTIKRGPGRGVEDRSHIAAWEAERWRTELGAPCPSLQQECLNARGRKQFLDLPWEDVLFPHILSYLPLRQLVQLQRVSKTFQCLIQRYLTNMRCFDSSQVGPRFPRAAFRSLLKEVVLLQQLALRNCSDWLSDQDLLPVIAQNPGLQQIELSGCAQLSRHVLVAISLSCPGLRQLSLAHCEWVDGLSLRSLADHCRELESLDLTACRQLKDEAICYLVQKCHRLKSLSLAVNANVGDAAVEEIAKACPELEHLDLTGCLRVKNHSIRTLAEYCPKLRALKVKHCHDVVESSLSVLRSRGVELDVEPPLQRALVLLQDVGFANFINLQN